MKKVVLSLYLLLFPLVASAVFTEISKLTSLDGESEDFFGHSLAIDGTTVVVGAQGRGNGAAYVFDCSNATCTQVDKLIAPDGAAGDDFGFSVAISGQLIVVGSPASDVDGNEDQGAAYVFFCPSPSSCSFASKLNASDGSLFDNFGFSVSISDSLVVVGAYSHDTGGNMNQGAAYVFNCSGFPCEEVTRLDPTDGNEYDEFGRAVSISERLIVVGARFHDVSSPDDNQGAAYLFECSLPGSCAQRSKITASNGVSESFFGISVGISGTSVIVGAHGAGTGAAYLFDCSNPNLCQELEELTASDAVGSHNFGFSVAIQNSYVVVGARLHPVDGKTNHGAVYTFNCSSTCVEIAKMISSDGQASDNFGFSVALSDRWVISGAINHMVEGNFKQGAAYLLPLADIIQIDIVLKVHRRAHSGTSSEIVMTLIGTRGLSNTVSIGTGFSRGETVEFSLYALEVGELYAVRLANQNPSDGFRVLTLQMTYKGTTELFGKNEMIQGKPVTFERNFPSSSLLLLLPPPPPPPFLLFLSFTLSPHSPSRPHPNHLCH